MYDSLLIYAEENAKEKMANNTEYKIRIEMLVNIAYSLYKKDKMEYCEKIKNQYDIPQKMNAYYEIQKGEGALQRYIGEAEKLLENYHNMLYSDIEEYVISDLEVEKNEFIAKYEKECKERFGYSILSNLLSSFIIMIITVFSIMFMAVNNYKLTDVTKYIEKVFVDTNSSK